MAAGRQEGRPGGRGRARARVRVCGKVGKVAKVARFSKVEKVGKSNESRKSKVERESESRTRVGKSGKSGNIKKSRAILLFFCWKVDYDSKSGESIVGKVGESVKYRFLMSSAS